MTEPSPDPDADRERSELAHAIAHELLTPLSSVAMGLAAIRVAAQELPAGKRAIFDSALVANARAVGFVRAVIEWFDSGLALGPYVDVDCDEMVRRLVAERGIADAVTVGPLPRLRGDRAALRRLFGALLDNAVRYAGEAPPRVEVRSCRAGDWWSFEIADDGIGIEAAQRERVFEPLVRLHSWDEKPGFGLGLSLSRRVVERHGGSIELAARDGGGTVVRFTLPA